MTEGNHQQPEDLLDAYADGLLTTEQRETVEQALLARPELKRQLHRQRAIDDALRRRLTPPPAHQLQAVLEQAGTAAPGPAKAPGPARAPWRLMARRLAVAAALAAGAFGAWQIWSFMQPRLPGYQPMPWRTLAAIYQDEITSGFEPDWVCKDDQEFSDTFDDLYGQRLLLEPLPQGVAALGLAYGNSISQRTIYLLAEAANEPIVVFIDRAERDAGQSIESDTGLHLFERRVGDLILYELSPFAEPRLLDSFYDPDAIGH